MSNECPELDLYPFEYPSVEELLQQLDLSETNEGDPPFIDQRGRQGLRIAGMSHVDDFTMMSPVQLSIISAIVPEKISILYSLVWRIIKSVHNNYKEDKESIDHIRGMHGQFQNVR